MQWRVALPIALLTAVPGPGRAADEPALVGFRDLVAPILVRKCLGCHNDAKAAGGFRMTTFSLLKKGGKTAPDLILAPGDPDASELVISVRADAAPRMPYKLPPLSDSEIEVLTKWVRQGAKFDGPSETETTIASLYDPLKGLPKVAASPGATDAFTSAAFSPDGATIAAGAGRSTFLFDAATGKLRATLSDHWGVVYAVGFTPDGESVYAAGGRAGISGAVTVWKASSGVRVLDFPGHTDVIQAADVSPDGRTLATASYDRTVVLWDLAAGRRLRTLKEHNDAVHDVAFSPDGKSLATASADRTLKTWDVASGRRLSTFSESTAELYTLAYSADGSFIYSGGFDRTLRAWRPAVGDAGEVKSALAHDGPVIRLVASADGKTLVSSGEDRAVKVWDAATLSPLSMLPTQSDWPQAIALSPDGKRLVVGRHDGSLGVFDLATGKATMELRGVGSTAKAPKPELVRAATLNPPTPRGAALGSQVRLTLSGNGVRRATSVVFQEPGLSASIVPEKAGSANTLKVDLRVAPDARPGVHLLTVTTPLGVPPFQSFAVDPYPSSESVEPDDDPATLKPLTPPLTFTGTIDKPGDFDHVRLTAKAGRTYVVRTVARSLGSVLRPSLTVQDDSGRGLTVMGFDDGVADPVLTVKAPRDGVLTLRVGDADYGGSPKHFYRIDVDTSAHVESVTPLGVERGRITEVSLAGVNVPRSTVTSVAVSGTTDPGTLVDVPIKSIQGQRPAEKRSVVVADGSQALESEPNDDTARANAVSVPGGATGLIGREGDVDLFRFRGRRGERLVLEVFGTRLGTAIDSKLEILGSDAKPLPRALLRPLTSTEVAFRDHNATVSGIRLTHWENLAVDDAVLIGRELTRIVALPRNPDDDCQFSAEDGRRTGLLETTPEHHPMGQPVVKVEIHPPGSALTAGGAPAVVLTYANDDGGPTYGSDSRLTFDPPADGAYFVRVSDARGYGGPTFGYHLVVRRARPDYRLAVSTPNPTVPRGHTALVGVNLTRLDGFDGAVEVTAENLPTGVTCTPAVIERGMTSAQLALSAEPTAPTFSPPTWTLQGRSLDVHGAVSSAGDGIRRRLDPGDPVARKPSAIEPTPAREP